MTNRTTSLEINGFEIVRSEIPNMCSFDILTTAQLLLFSNTDELPSKLYDSLVSFCINQFEEFASASDSEGNTYYHSSTVISLFKQGNTVLSIAGMCGLTDMEVQDILRGAL